MPVLYYLFFKVKLCFKNKTLILTIRKEFKASEPYIRTKEDNERLSNFGIGSPTVLRSS